MTVEAALPEGHPALEAWDRYRASSAYENSRKWALIEEHVDGSMWAAFCHGYMARSLTEIATDWDSTLQKAKALCEENEWFQKRCVGTPLENDIPVMMAEFALGRHKGD